MNLYNTLTKKVEKLVPINEGIISLYTCGPTVYDYYHIGNLRNAVFNDTLRRTLEINNFKVSHVMNITDVGHLASDSDEGEDKLEKGAAREGKSVEQVAEHYTKAFKNDMQKMNVLPPNAYKSKKYDDFYARATEFIEEQIEIIRILIDKGYAYQTEQAIYFNVTKLPDYGILSGQRLVDKEVGAREDVVTDSSKQSPHDFAVWFFTVGRFKDHSMHWPSPWGNGFPGWHLECSAIIHAILGDPIDIHTGGVDHIGTHHPNEMAQTEAAFGNKLANMWVHNEFILVDGQKMSKSKNNSYTLADLEKKGYSALDYRMMVLQAHYRSELNFSWDNLESATMRLKSLAALADLKYQTSDSYVALPEDYFNDLTAKILTALQEDLRTPEVLRLLSESTDYIEQTCVGINTSNKEDFENFLQFFDKTLGLKLDERQPLSEEQMRTLLTRQQMRNEKNWDAADKLRYDLLQENIVVRDTPKGQIWSRV